GQAPSWLKALLSCGGGRCCVASPPLPAILALPIVPFASTAAAQVIASRIAGGVSAGILYLGLRAYGAPRAYAVAGVLLSAFGTTLFFSSVDGRAWYAAHAAAMLFLAALPPASAVRDLHRAAGSRRWHAVLLAAAFCRHEPLPHDTGVPLGVRRTSRDPPRRGGCGDGRGLSPRPPSRPLSRHRGFP